MYRDEEFVISSEAALLLGLSDRRITELCVRGQLPALKIARDWLIRRSDVSAYGHFPVAKI